MPPQVENEALALLQQDSDGNRRYTCAELIMRAAGHPSPDFVPAPGIEVVLHARWPAGHAMPHVHCHAPPVGASCGWVLDRSAVPLCLAVSICHCSVITDSPSLCPRLHGNPDKDGNITYMPGNILGMSGLV